MTDLINHPPHYTSSAAKCTCGRTIECIDVVRHLSFNLGNVLKYCWRADLKGDSLADLRKAAFYIADEIAKREAEQPEAAKILAEIEISQSCGNCKHGAGGSDHPPCINCDTCFTRWEPRA